MTITAKFASTCTACKGTITPGQRIDWTRGVGSRHILAADCAAATAQRVAAVATPAPVVDLASVVTFLSGARDRGLKSPRVRFAAPGAGELALSLAPLTGKNPGAVYVKLRGEYAGKVTADGAAHGLTSELVDALRTIAADPAAAGAAYGRLTGQCSFCTQGLTDEGSIEVGYGPVCAKRYGLPHKPRGSAKVTPVLAPAPAVVAGVEVGWNDWPALGAALRTPSPYKGRTIGEAAQPAWVAPAVAALNAYDAQQAGGDYDGTLDMNEAAAVRPDDFWTL